MIHTLTLNPALDREITVPEIAFDEVLRATEVRVDAGGKGFNVSRAIAALGGRSVAMGLVGGITGERLRGALTALGIEADLVAIGGETRTNTSIVAANGGRHLKVNEPGPTITDAERASLLRCVRERAKRDDLWVLAGSLPPGIPATFYADLVRELEEVGARAIVDTSGEALRHACRAAPFLVKPNATEASELTGLSVDTVEEALKAAQRVEGVSRIVVSVGRAGAVLMDGEESWIVTPPEVVERNPVGAGDSLVAGLAWALDRGEPLLDALRWGVACGAAAASRAGTGVGTGDEVARLVESTVARRATAGTGGERINHSEEA